MTKTKIALAAVLFAATSSAALAQGFDPNMANRYPSYANPAAPAPQATTAHRTLQSAPVALRQGRTAGLRVEQPSTVTGQPSEIDVDRGDHASSPYAGGGF
jgi:hypothetical protein